MMYIGNDSYYVGFDPSSIVTNNKDVAKLFAPKLKETLMESTKEQKTEKDSIKKALSIVSATYNHQINNALAPVMMASQLLKSKSNDPEVIKAMELIISSAKKINEFTQKINQLEQTGTINTTEYINGTYMIDV